MNWVVLSILGFELITLFFRIFRSANYFAYRQKSSRWKWFWLRRCRWFNVENSYASIQTICNNYGCAKGVERWGDMHHLSNVQCPFSMRSFALRFGECFTGSTQQQKWAGLINRSKATESISITVIKNATVSQWYGVRGIGQTHGIQWRFFFQFFFFLSFFFIERYLHRGW